MNPESPQATPSEPRATPEQVSGEAIREAATESVRAGVDIRARVHDVTLLALKARRFSTTVTKHGRFQTTPPWFFVFKLRCQ